MKCLVVATAALFLALANSAFGALMFDMGPTSTIAAPANSPAHSTGAVPLTETTWNTVFNSNIPSGSVLNSDGTTATGVSVTVGAGSGTAGTIDFTTASPYATNLTGTSGTSLGSDYGTGTGTSPANPTAATDGVFKSGAGGGSLTASAGVRIDGLAAGTYTVYGVLRNTNTSSTTSNESLYTAAAPSATTFAFGALIPANVANSEGSGNNTWIAGDQYATSTVTVAAGQSLYVIANGGVGSAETRGMMNSIQIVTPEPGTGSLVLVVGALACIRRRRRRRSSSR